MTNESGNKAVEVKDSAQKVAWQVDPGQVRSRNEATIRVATVQLDEGEESWAMGIYAVADGAVGHSIRDDASLLGAHTATRRLAAQAAVEAGHDPLPPDYQKWLGNAVSLANHVLLNQNKDAQVNMLTTLVLAAVVGNEAHIVNVGNSRAYVIREAGIYQITKDHSVAQLLVEEGVIRPEDAADHPRSNVLTQAMGQDNLSPDLFEVTLEVGDFLLLCSDGLWGELSDDQIWQIVRLSDSVQTACQNLVDAANAAGGRDNIAVILVKTKKDEPGNWLDRTFDALRH